MNYSTFYYDLLTKKQQDLYMDFARWFADGKSLPLELPFVGGEDSDIEKAYEALFLDSPDSSLPPLREIYFLYHKNKCHLFLKENSSYIPFTSEELSRASVLVQEARERIQAYDSIYQRVIVATRYLHSQGAYLLDHSINGEAPAGLLLYHSAYCTGIARTTKLLVDSEDKGGIICVQGYLKKEFSLVKTANGGNTPHMWCAFFDAQRDEWIYFDPTPSLRVANNKRIAKELREGKYRRDYSNGKYRNTKFYTRKKLNERYILRDEA